MPGSVFAALATAMVVIGALGVAPVAAQGPDKSDVVQVFDFSASILMDTATRNRFAAALERIAARVDETSSDLVAGDTTVSLVRFASKAQDVPSCVDLRLLNSPAAVAHYADCLRSVASAYRKGITPGLTKAIGVDTNYIAAMSQAAKHIPADSERPVVIFFTDGKHDVKGVPASRVIPARDQLFGKFPSFALLPVGMGIDPKQRPALTAGLEDLRVIRDMPACVSGTTFDWPQVGFDSPDQAGNAVGTALADATCTFTVAPTPTPPPKPTPAAVTAIKLTAGDGVIDVSWTPASAAPGSPGASAPAATGYQARCRPEGSGDDAWVASGDKPTTEPTASITGLTNGTAYECQVAAVGADNTGAWTAASATVMPVGLPTAPPKPAVEALNAAARVSVPAATGAPDDARIQYECSSDNGTTWPVKADAAADDPVAEVNDLTNGTDYTCRAFSANSVGTSDASPISDTVRPCGSPLQCNPILLPILGVFGLLLVGGVVAALYALFGGRPKGYVVAVVDVIHTANIGQGQVLGIDFERDPATKAVIGIVANKGRNADVRIRQLKGGKFAVRDRTGRHEVADGDSLVVADSVGVRHSLTLRAFATNAASQVASRR
jgi:hypothetical protein